ncbi:hypothetical protein ACHAXH_003700 [Discostella pseudostelligera]
MHNASHNRIAMKPNATPRNKRLPLSPFCFIAVAALAALAVPPSSAFVAPPSIFASRPSFLSFADNEDENQSSVDEASSQSNSDLSPIAMGQSFRFPNPLVELADMFSNFDDVVDDFFNKRMGNGEVFYGKRKYKPSGKVDAEYNGGGFSDWRKMEAAREFREMRALMREETKERSE